MDAVTHNRKLALLNQPHMQPLLAYRDKLIERTNRKIPHFDPEDGGTRAELLLLLSHVDGDPGSERSGSAFISVENDDQTARNLHRVIDHLGLSRETLLIWNVVPWQDGHPAKQAELGAIHLPRLVQALPQLRGIAVLSREGQILKAVQDELAHVHGLEWKLTSSPAPRAYNQHGGQLTLDLQTLARRLSLI